MKYKYCVTKNGNEYCFDELFEAIMAFPGEKILLKMTGVIQRVLTDFNFKLN